MTESKNNINLSFTNSHSEIEGVVSKIENWLRNLGCSERIIRRILVCLDEILTNIISYAYNDDKEHEIKLDAKSEAGFITLQIEDDGVSFNPCEWAEPDTSLPPEERKLGGLGIFFVKKFVDAVTYLRKGERNILILKKQLD